MDLGLSQYLEDLCRPARRSRGERTIIAQDIEENRESIDGYIKELELKGKHRIARRYRKAVEKYSLKPRGMHYTESIGAVRSFVPTRKAPSFTVPTDRRWERKVWYAAVAVMLGITAYVGYLVYEVVQGLGKAMEARITAEGEENILEKRLEKMREKKQGKKK